MYIVQGKNNRETRKSTPKQIPKGLKLHFFFLEKRGGNKNSWRAGNWEGHQNGKKGK